MLTWKYIGVIDIKEKQHFKLFYYIHIVEIPTNKGANSYKRRISKIGNLCEKNQSTQKKLSCPTC